jgi:hypothetical protein
VTILFWSDLHANAVTMGVRRHTELERVCDIVESTAISANVSTVIFGGDLTDPEPEGWGCVARAIELDRRLRDAGKQVLWMTGNHDVVEDGRGSSTLSPMRGCGAAVINKPELVQTLEDGIIGFLPFTPRALAYNPADVVQQWGQAPVQEAPCMVFGHLNLKDAVPGSETHDMPRGREVQWPLDALRQWLPAAQLYGGHYHGASEINGVNIVGAPALFTFGEELYKPSFFVIEKGEARRVAIEPFARFRTLQYDVDTGHLYHEGKKHKRPAGDTRDVGGKLEQLVSFSFVRVQASRDFADAEQMECDMLAAGALAVRVEVQSSEVKPAAATDAPLETVHDGVAEARRLASEWATADAELKAEIEVLVNEVAEEVCST